MLLEITHANPLKIKEILVHNGRGDDAGSRCIGADGETSFYNR